MTHTTTQNLTEKDLSHALRLCRGDATAVIAWQMLRAGAVYRHLPRLLDLTPRQTRRLLERLEQAALAKRQAGWVVGASARVDVSVVELPADDFMLVADERQTDLEQYIKPPESEESNEETNPPDDDDFLGDKIRQRLSKGK